MDVQTYKDALLKKRVEILGTGGIKPLQASMENNTRQGDMADQASGNNEVHIALKLKQTDAKILQAIEEALWRIEKGTYGVCRDCGEPIAEARLNAIPWTRVCITCKEKQGYVSDLLSLLQEFHREKLDMMLRHQAGARLHRPVRRQQHLSVHHQSRRRAAVVARGGDCRARRPNHRSVRAGSDRDRTEGRCPASDYRGRCP